MVGVTNRRMGSSRKDLLAPCKNCDTEHPGERHPGCHDHCGRYKEYRETLEALHSYEKQTQAAGEYYDPQAPAKRRFY